MSHVLNNEGTLEICTGDDAGCQLIITDNFIIAYPDGLDEVATFGASDEDDFVEVASLVLQSDQTDFETAKSLLEEAGGIVFLNGAQY
jgi:hypothetical protein